MKTNKSNAITALSIVTGTPETSTYAAIFGATPEARKELLKTTTGTTTTGDLKKTAAKILAAMIAAGDCKASEIKETAEQITGTDIREIFQGVYELRVVFSSLVAGEIDLVEAEFDSIGSSILGLLSPFIQKDELKPLLPEAVKLAKSGTAAQIRALKPKGEVKEPKAVKAMREKAEAAEAKAVEAEERVKAAEQRAADIESRYTVNCQFAITDIKRGAPVLESQQLRDRIKADLLAAKERNDETSLLFQHDKLVKAYFGVCQLLGVDPLDGLADLAATMAKATKQAKPGKAAGQTLEVESKAA